ncbi:hypothetical protein BCD67_19125 [Oscillatoriales cyanobacterium USR001]|nr:hypothetical protein BCD67_19125 [Oscillatoriales cyanobacterium USR001]
MPKVLIVMGADFDAVSSEGRIAEAFQRAIAGESPLNSPEICLISDLSSIAIAPNETILCPLTLDIPETLVFPGQIIYQACRDISSMRDRVLNQFGTVAGVGNFWLPIVLTAKGPIYGEVIGLNRNKLSSESISQINYSMPCHFSDIWRQKLYKLGFNLLQILSAPPATYLMQFGFEDQKIYFDRLWPFPAAPSIASVGVQFPDLFNCHWYCLTNLPIYDMQITSN